MNETPQDIIQRLQKSGSKIIEGFMERSGIEGLQRVLSDKYPDKAHYIYELLQNAEDAGAPEVWFHLHSDKLTFLHNGSKFTGTNVERILDVGNSDKRGKESAIGCHGVGFKAVFTITETPRITSGDFSFEIQKLFYPADCERLTSDQNLTVFEFPFKGPEPKTQACYAEALDGLKKLNEGSLLFLRNIKKLNWLDGDSPTAWLERIERRHKDAEEIVEVRGARLDGEQSSTLWLKFERVSKLLPSRTVAVAYKLEMRGEQKSLFDEQLPGAQLRIGETKGLLHVFFPAVNVHTGLRFHIHGPYATTSARDSLPDGSCDNRTLLAETAQLVGESLKRICELKLLNRHCLDVLPNSRDELSDFCAPIRAKVLEVMQRQALVPARDGKHHPAALMRLHFKELDELFDNSDLAALEGLQGLQWAVRASANSAAIRLLRDLGIPEFNASRLMERMHAVFGETLDVGAIEWLKSKPDDWLRRFYGVLLDGLCDAGHYSAGYTRWLRPEERIRVVRWQVVRTEDENLCRPKGIHLPKGDGDEPGFVYARRALVMPFADSPLSGEAGLNELTKARQFLNALGVFEVLENDRINQLLARHYGGLCPSVPWEDHVAHMRRFIEWWRKMSDTERFKSARIFLGEDGKWHTGGELFLDSPESRLSALYSGTIEGIPHRCALIADYETAGIEALTKFIVALGAKERLEIIECKITDNPKESQLRRGSGQDRSYLNKDYVLEFQQALLGAKNRDIALLVWMTVAQASVSVLKARYKRTAGADERSEDSQLVCGLRDAAWIPDRTDGWRKPAKMIQEDLPADFRFYNANGWLTEIGFGSAQSQKSNEKDARRKTAESVGIPGDLLDVLEGLSEADRKKEIERFVEELKRRKRPASEPVQAADFPTELQKAVNRLGKAGPLDPPADSDSISDPARRSLKLDAEIKDARDNERPAGDRQRAVTRTVWEAKDPQTCAFLVQEYAGHCQVCGETFRQRDGGPYFEAVHFVSRTHEGMAWADRSGNALCLCPTCCAKFKFGAVESGDFIEQVKSLKLRAEGGSGKLDVRIRLCEEEVFIRYEERHLLELRQMLDASKAPPADTPAQSAPAGTQLVQCPHCSDKVRSDRLELHIQRIHGSGGSGGQLRHGIRKTATDDMTQRTRCRDCGRLAMPGDDRCYSCA